MKPSGPKQYPTEYNGLRVGSWVYVRGDCGQITQLFHEGQYRFAVQLYTEHGSYAYRLEEVEPYEWN